VPVQSNGHWSVADLTEATDEFGSFSFCLALIGLYLTRRRIPDLTSIPQDPLVTAALMGGAERIVQATITRLARSGALLLTGSGTCLTISGPYPVLGTPVEQAVYDQLAAQSSIGVIELLKACQGLRAVQDIVRSQPRLPTELRIHPLWLIPLCLSTIPNLGLLSYRLHRHFAADEALPSWRTFFFNAMLILLNWDLWRSKNLRRELLKRLQETYPDKGAQLESKPPAEWARAVAIYGPHALLGTALADYVVQFGYVP